MVNKFVERFIRGKAYFIRLNRPTKRNAINVEMYGEIIAGLSEAENSRATVTVLTGVGKYFTSGNDFGFLRNADEVTKHCERFLSQEPPFSTLVRRLIEHKKPLIALVNGPAVGFGVTILPLFDYVLASDEATLHCPFTQLSITPEGCSTYTFPYTMGYLKACEMLLFGEKISARQAQESGLITKIAQHEVFGAVAEELIERLSCLPLQHSIKIQ